MMGRGTRIFATPRHVAHYILGIVGLCFPAAASHAAPVFNPANGHYYDSITVPGNITWSAASTAASGLSHQGNPGHLVAITSAAENDFIFNNLPTAISGNYWIGGFQDTASPNFSEPAGGWSWVTGESFTFTNWQTNEPNNALGFPPSEENLQILSNGKWNDAPGGTGLGGYVVEFEPARTFQISGRVANGQGYAIPSVSILRTGSNTPVQTNTAGYYTFFGVPAGSYTLTPSKAEYSFTPASRSVTINTSNIANQNFLGKTGVSVSGRVSTIAGAAIPGVVVSRTGGANPVTTNSAGYYTFIGVQPGTTTITPAKSGVRFTPTSKTITVAGSDISGENFIGNTGYDISGRIADGSGNGVAGIVVKRSGSNLTGSSNSAGFYTFTDVPNGTYTITPTGTGLSFSPENRSVTINNANVSGQNFTVAPGYSITGRITTSSGVAVANVIVTRTGSSISTITNSAGYFTFNGVANGTYTILPSASGMTFTPVTRTTTVNNANVAGQNFTGAPS